jgi:hypothetical protein
MYLPLVINSLRLLLEEFSLKAIANYPNLYGVYEQSEVVLDVSEGEAVGGDTISDESINLSIKVSVATGKATNLKSEYDESDRDLDTIISLIIFTLRKKVIPGGKRIKFEKFQKFTPESGKHRALISFSVIAYITDFTDVLEDDNRIKEIKINFRN